MSIEETLEQLLEKKLEAMKADIIAAIMANKEEAGNRLLTMKEAGARLKVSQYRLREIIKKGALQVAKTPGGFTRVSEAAINAYINKITGGIA